MFSAVSVCQFVCLFVSLFVNTITSEWLNVGWWNLAVRCIVQKSRQSSNIKVNFTRYKKWKTGESSPLTMHSKAFAVRCTQQQMIPLRRSRGWQGDGGSGPRGSWVHQFYAFEKISACCLVMTCYWKNIRQQENLKWYGAPLDLVATAKYHVMYSLHTYPQTLSWDPAESEVTAERKVS